ncbi:MAG: hypothetical protein QE159_06095 [Candidatus Verstraetearchaeota archaeon]|nr:hypothetical protein [Candidatus Verstraetearchaeota archaeon]
MYSILKFLIFLLIISLFSSHTIAENITIFYLSDIQLGEPIQVIKTLNSISYNNLIEEFSNPPYDSVDIWCSQNNWSYSGNCPKWNGILWLGITSNGNLQWHNWLHTIGGAVYNFSMWKDLDFISPDFELYIPINTWRFSGGLAGSPPLYIHFELYDKYGAQLFQAIIVYDGIYKIKEIISKIYGKVVTSSLSLSSINLKLWQNSSGVYFSIDNGTSILINGIFLTIPYRFLIRFYIWEYNPIQPYSDYEFYINIDKIMLISKPKSSIIFSGLPLGNWYFINSSNGNVLFNKIIDIHGDELSYPCNQSISGILNGLVNYTYAISGEFYYNTTIEYINENLKITQSQPSFQLFFDDCSSLSGWSGANLRFSDYSYGYDCNGQAIRAWYWTIYMYGSCNHWLEKSINLYGKDFTISFMAMLKGSSSHYLEAKINSISLKLSNGTYIINNNITKLILNQWLNVSYSFNFSSFVNIIAIRINIYMYGYYYPNINTFIDNFTIMFFGNSGITIKGVPLNSVIELYEESNLIKSIISNGEDIVISDISNPFHGSIVVINRPYLIPLAIYTGILDWNDVLIYSQGKLIKSSSNIESINVIGGSECNSISNWTFNYNLITGGTTPTFSSSLGYVRFDCNRISYYNNPYGDSIICEAWFYLYYNLSDIVKNLTISTYVDGLFTYSSSGIIYEQWGEIILYLIKEDNWIEIIRSSKSINPLLNITINISPNNFISINNIVIAFHTYARGESSYALYSNPIWGRVDYLRLSYQKIPDDYLGISIIGLNPSHRIVFDSNTYWANISGIAIIPKNASSWPINQSIYLYPSSESYIGIFQSGIVYYPFKYKIYKPITNTIFYEIKENDSLIYRTEFTLLNYSIISPISLHYVYTFTFKMFINNQLQNDIPPKVFINGIPQNPRHINPYTYQIIAKSNTLIEIYDSRGIRLAGFLP